MNRLLAVAMLAIRSALRSRLFVSLLGALVVAVLWAPVTIHGDGTLAGQVRLLLTYCLGLASLILGAGTLWAACGSIALEIEDRSIWLVAVKPIPRLRIWLGKWLGLVLMNAVWVSAVGVLTLLLIGWTLRSWSAPAEDRRAVWEEVLIGRQSFQPEAEDVGPTARAEYERLRREGRTPPGLTRREAQAVLAQRERIHRATIEPDAMNSWLIRLPARLPSPTVEGPAGCVLRVHFRFSGWEGRPVRGAWRVGTPRNPDLHVTPVRTFAEGRHAIALPAAILKAGEPLSVTFVNQGAQESSTAVLDPGRGVELLVARGGFLPNFARSLTVLLCRLALLAAIGLLAGAVFSFPVAAFTSLATVLAVLLSEYFLAESGSYVAVEDSPVFVQWLGFHIADGVHFLARPVVGLSPIAHLADGLRVSSASTLRAILFLAVVYPLLCGAVAATLLRRRELGLPEAA
jgi:hypothetical protein